VAADDQFVELVKRLTADRRGRGRREGGGLWAPNVHVDADVKLLAHRTAPTGEEEPRAWGTWTGAPGPSLGLPGPSPRPITPS